MGRAGNALLGFGAFGDVDAAAQPEGVLCQFEA